MRVLYLFTYVITAIVYLVQRKKALDSIESELPSSVKGTFREFNRFTYVDFILAFIPAVNVLSALLSVMQFSSMRDQFRTEFENYCYINYISYYV